MKKQIIAALVAALLIAAIGVIWYIDIQDNQDINNDEDTSNSESNDVIDAKDTDSDGLSDEVEAEIGTNPNNPNTDGDRYNDGDEYNDIIPSYVENEGRSPLFPAYPDIEVELGKTFHIWLKQDITVSTGIIESKDYEYNIECTTFSTTDWSNVLTVEAGFGILGPSVSVKDTFSYHNSKTHIMKTSENYKIATGKTWSQAVATDLGESYLYITIRIKNTGNDILNSEIKDIWLSLYLGDDEDPIKTWSFGNSYIGGSICPLLPGEVRTVNAEFVKCLSVETLKRIDSGEPVRIEVQNYNIGDDNIYLQNVKDSLVQLDIDSGSNVQTIFVQEENILLVDFLKKYANAVISNGNSFQSINGLQIDSKNWWNIILPKKTDIPNDLTLVEIEKGDHVVLIYEQDSDNDRITNRLETMAGTNPNSVDSDGDGLNDFDELYDIYGETNPILSDSDFDSLSDYEEVFNGNDGYITDPQDSDTDNDGLEDYNEYLNNTDPTNSDTDSDGLNDGEECTEYFTNPTKSDTDNDGLMDGDEVTRKTDPLDDDSDDDGLNDGDEISASCNPLDEDTDDDGFVDGLDYVPLKDAKIKVNILKVKVIDEVDGWPGDPNKAQVYFHILVNNNDNRVPSSSYKEVTRNILETLNWEIIYDVDDSIKLHEVSIRMWDDDAGWGDDQLDIDGHDNSRGCTVNYDIYLETWSGDDNDGITDGSYDGTQYSDDDDAYLEYGITVV